MPGTGGSPYKQVTSSLKTATVGPNSITDVWDGDDEGKADGGENGGDIGQCQVQAFDVWYWADDGSFVPETMYLNTRDPAHAQEDPRLIVSLSSFQSLSQAYVTSVQKENVKAAMLQEKENLLGRCRVGYYKELQHLREMLEMARQHMMMGKGGIDDIEAKRRARFEQMVKETEVHYFDIVDTLDPELKGLLKDAVKQFNKELMREIFELRDRLALHEGGDDGDIQGLIERLLIMLMGKGISPSQIVKVLSGMITDSQQSDEFRDTLRDILGISKSARPPEDDKPARKVAKKEEVKETPVVEQNTGGRRRGGDDDKVEKIETKAAGGEDAGALKMQLAQKDAEIERLKKMLEEQKQKFEQQARDAEAKFKAMEQEMKKFKAEAEAARKERDAAEKRAKKAEADAEAAAERARRAEANQGGTVVREVAQSGGGKKKEESQVIMMESPGGRGGGGNDFDSEEAARLRAELEKKLREAMERINALKQQLADAGNVADDRGASKKKPVKEPEDDSRNRPAHVKKAPEGNFKKREDHEIEVPNVDDDGDKDDFVRKKKKPIVDKGMDLMDRNFGADLRGGEYSLLTGRPMAMVEAELNAERKRRIGLEEEKRKLVSELCDLRVSNDKTEFQLEKEVHQLGKLKAKMDAMIGQDELEGIDDVAIFCRWLIKKYGGIDRGFRALDTNLNGDLSYTEFCRGLTQMGWIQIVGRRLFNVIDPKEKGHLTLPMLWEVYHKYVEGMAEDPETTKKMEQLARQHEEHQEENRKLEIAKDRIKEVESEKAALQDEIVILKKKAARALGEANKPSENSDKLKAQERKGDALKTGYENLKGERDELASKMTAAMWKCREAYILQVKYKRDADTKTEEFGKLTKKFELFKSHFKNRMQGDPMSPSAQSMPAGGFAHSQGMDPFSMSSPGAMMAGGMTLSLMNDCADDTDGKLESTAALASGVLSGALNDDVATQPGSPGGGIRCPKCNASLRFGPSPGGPDAQDAAAAAGMSPEDLIAKMSDEDLLGGKIPGQSPQASRRSPSPQRTGFLSTGGQMDALGVTHAMMSQESAELIDHARQIRLLWREAVPIDEVFPRHQRAAPNEAEIKGGSSRVPLPGAVTVGRTVQRQKLAQYDGDPIPIDEELLQKLQAKVEETAGKQAGEQFAAAAANVKQLHKQNLQPFEEGPGVVGTGIPSLHDGPTGVQLSRSLGNQNIKAAVLQDYSKQARDSHFLDTPSPPLLIVGANAPPDLRNGTPPARRPASFADLHQPEQQRSRGPDRISASDGFNGHFGMGGDDLEDDGIKNRSRGNKNVGGSWRSHHANARGGDNSGASAGEQIAPIGSGLPTAIGTSSGKRTAAARRVPQQLPQLSPDRQAAPAMGIQAMRPSASMPNLAMDMARPGKLSPPPPAMALVSPSPDRSRPRQNQRNMFTPPESAVARAAAEAPFEASSLRVGNPAPLAPTGLRPAKKRALGASGCVPKEMTREQKQLMMASGAFELGSHVQRHAATEMAPVVIQGGSLPVVHGVGGKALLA